MRIAFIAPLFESVPPRLYGGTERVIDHLCRGVQAAGTEVTLFASGDSAANVPLVPVVDRAFRLRETPVMDPYAYNLRMLALVAKHAEEFDVIHNHHDYWMLPLSEMTSTPLLTTLHGRLDLPDIAAAFMSYPKSYFVSISNSQRGPLAMLNWVRTIYHGLDLKEFEFNPRHGSYLAFLGRITWEKRPDLAIQMARRSGVPLKIAAKIEGRESEQYFEEYIKPHVDGKFIEYIGEISDREKSEFLGNALALAFPIDWPEPFGLAVIEALACGTPVLARPFGSIPELLQDGVTGYCHREIEVLAERVKDIQSIDRQGCRDWVEQRFSLQRMTEDYIDVYRELTESTRRAAQEGARRSDRHRRNLIHSV